MFVLTFNIERPLINNQIAEHSKGQGHHLYFISLDFSQITTAFTILSIRLCTKIRPFGI
jgi:hypothetical protein